MRTDPRTPPVRRAAPQVNDIDEQEYQQLFQEGQVPSVEHLCYISREITEPAYQMLAYYTRCGLQRWPVLARPPEDAPPRPATGAAWPAGLRRAGRFLPAGRRAGASGLRRRVRGQVLGAGLRRPAEAAQGVGRPGAARDIRLRQRDAAWESHPLSGSPAASKLVAKPFFFPEAAYLTDFERMTVVSISPVGPRRLGASSALRVPPGAFLPFAPATAPVFLPPAVCVDCSGVCRKVIERHFWCVGAAGARWPAND